MYRKDHMHCTKYRMFKYKLSQYLPPLRITSQEEDSGNKKGQDKRSLFFIIILVIQFGFLNWILNVYLKIYILKRCSRQFSSTCDYIIIKHQYIKTHSLIFLFVKNMLFIYHTEKHLKDLYLNANSITISGYQDLGSSVFLYIHLYC